MAPSVMAALDDAEVREIASGLDFGTGEESYIQSIVVMIF
jgi:hypothetical protein